MKYTTLTSGVDIVVRIGGTKGDVCRKHGLSTYQCGIRLTCGPRSSFPKFQIPKFGIAGRSSTHEA